MFLPNKKKHTYIQNKYLHYYFSLSKNKCSLSKIKCLPSYYTLDYMMDEISFSIVKGKIVFLLIKNCNNYTFLKPCTFFIVNIYYRTEKVCIK